MGSPVVPSTVPSTLAARGKVGRGGPGSSVLLGSSPQSVPQFPLPPCRTSRIKVVAPASWGQLSPPELEIRIRL